MKALFFRLLLMLGLSLGTPAFIRAQDLSDIERDLVGKPIASVRFQGWERTRELSANLDVKAGEELRAGAIEQALATLFDKNLFENVAVEVTKSPSGIEILFRLSPLRRVREIVFEGNYSLTPRRLQRSTGLFPGARFSTDAVEQGRERIEKLYRDNGFLGTVVKWQTFDYTSAAEVRIRYDIDEGPQTMVREIILPTHLKGEPRRILEDIARDTRGVPLSKESLRDLRKGALFGLRREGFLRSSVRIADIRAIDEDHADILLEVSPRTPVSFVFSGNTAFSPEELLAPLQLDERIAPFAKSTVDRLCPEIERIYQASGYFFVTCTVDEAPAPAESERTERRVFGVNISEGPIARLKALIFQGNRTFDDDTLAGVMNTKPRGFWTFHTGFVIRDVLAADLEALEEFYAQRGFPGMKASLGLSFSESDTRIDLTIGIIEAQPDRITEVVLRWQGDPVPGIQSVIQPGDLRAMEAMESERVRLEAELHARGYPNAHVEVSADPEGRAIITLEPGVAIKVGRIVYQGNIYSREEMLGRELTLRSGDLWRPAAMDESRSNLSNTGFFREVLLGPLDGTLDSPVEDLAVYVDERDSGLLDLEASLSTQDGLYLKGEVAQRNVEGRGFSLGIGFDGYFKAGGSLLDAGRARTFFRLPHLFDSDVELFSEAFFLSSIEIVDEYSFDRAGGSVVLRRNFTEDLTGSVGTVLYNEDLYDAEPDVIIGPLDTGTTRYVTFSSELQFDKRDDPFNPRDGYFMLAGAKISAKALGSEVNFVGGNAQASHYTPLGRIVTWANSIRGAILDPFGETKTIPISNRYFLGGHSSLRGFSRNEVGPRGVTGNIAGGDSSLVLNTELQFVVVDDVVAVLFLDAGQAFLLNDGDFTGDRHDLRDLRYSPGIGIRYRTPIGPLSAEYGIALDRENGERFGRFNFGIGGAF